MRLPLEQKLRPVQKALLWLIKRGLGTAPGPVLVSSYRKDLFGTPFSRCMQEGMRGLEHWSDGEAELFAAFVSKLNACHF